MIIWTMYNAGDSLRLDSLIKPHQSCTRSTGHPQDCLETYNDAGSLTMYSQVKLCHMSLGQEGEQTNSI
jgi:hypothetical protein